MAEEQALTPVKEKEGIALEFEGNHFIRRAWLPIIPCYNRGPESVEEGTFKLEPKGAYGAMERRTTDAKWRCLYTVSRNTLRVCTYLDKDIGKVPSKFSTEDDDSIVILNFERNRK